MAIAVRKLVRLEPVLGGPTPSGLVLIAFFVHASDPKQPPACRFSRRRKVCWIPRFFAVILLLRLVSYNHGVLLSRRLMAAMICALQPTPKAKSRGLDLQTPNPTSR